MKHSIFKILIPIFILVLIAESFLSWLGPRLIVETAHPYLRTKINALSKPEVESDVLILGDSVALQAVDALQLQKELGRPCFNLALVGRATIAGNYFMLKRYLKYHPKPKAIVMLNLYNTWARDFEWDNHRVGEFLMNHFSADIAADIAERKLSWSALYEIIHAWILNALPSLRYKYEIQKIESWKQLRSALSGSARLQMQNEMIKRRGTRPVYPKKDTERARLIEKDLAANFEFIEQHTFQESTLNTFYLDKILSWSQQNGVPVYWLFPPIFKEFRESQEALKYLEGVKNFLKSKAALNPFFILPWADYPEASLEELTDSIEHIDPEKAEEFTHQLALALRERLK